MVKDAMLPFVLRCLVVEKSVQKYFVLIKVGPSKAGSLYYSARKSWSYTPTLKDGKTMKTWESVWQNREDIRKLNPQRSDLGKS